MPRESPGINRSHLTQEQLGKRWSRSPTAIEILKSAGVITTLAGLYDLKFIEALEAIGFPDSPEQTTT